jgi:transcription initiation factor TFIID TATA-box-binding protein
MEKNLTVVNVVGTGQLPIPVNYEDVMNRADTPVLRYDPSIHQGLELRFEEDGPLITIYSTGKYIIRAESVDLLYEVRDSFLELMVTIDLLDSASDKEFKINNVVCNGNLGRELELEALVGDLSQGDASYDQDKFPGINYKPINSPCSILIFRSGKVVVTAAPDVKTAENAFQSLDDEITELIESSG